MTLLPARAQLHGILLAILLPAQNQRQRIIPLITISGFRSYSALAIASAPKAARMISSGTSSGVSSLWNTLRPETLTMMVTNRLTASQRANPGWLALKPGRGFGLGVSMVLERDKTDFMRRGSVGTVSWPGAFGGWWQADHKEASILVFLAHNVVDLVQMAKGIGLGVWGAIDTFQTLASAPQSQSPVSATAD